MTLPPRHITFLRLLCTDITYKEIAAAMGKSVRTVETYRNDLFIKLRVNTKVGLVVWAIKNKVVDIDKL